MRMVEQQQPRAREALGAYNGERMKVFLGLLAVAVAVTAAWVVSNRLSEESLAVLAGAVCGVGAAIPTSLIIVAISRRERGSREDALPSTPQSERGYPPVVIVTPQGTQQQPHNWNGLPPNLTPSSRREFTVVGGDATQSEAKTHFPLR